MRYEEFSNQSEYIDVLKDLAKCKVQYGLQCLYQQNKNEIKSVLEKRTIIGRELWDIFFENSDAKVLITKEELKETEKMVEERSRILLERGTALPLSYLFHLFACTSFERHCIILALVYELEKSFRRAFSFLQDEWELDYFTPYLAKLTFSEEVTDEQLYKMLAEDSKLLKFFFKEEASVAGSVLKKLYLEKRILAFILGEIEVYSAYSPYVTQWDYNEKLEAYLGTNHSLEYLFREIGQEVYEKDGGRVICLQGEEGSGKKFLLKHLCKRLEKNAFFFSLDIILQMQEEPYLIWNLIRECFLFQGIPIVTNWRTSFLQEEEKKQKVLQIFSVWLQCVPFVFLCMEEKGGLSDFLDREKIGIVPMESLSLFELKAIWEAEGKKYPMEEEIQAGMMANRISLTPGKIKEALKVAYEDTKRKGKEKIDQESLKAGCYSFVEEKMNRRAIRVPSFFSWEDLILPSYQKGMLKTACNQVKYKQEVYESWGFSSKITYGKGISMVFSGPPGTGKTMAAQVMAKELSMEMYKVELATVVSKYVGETEKNLNEIFLQAEKSQVILFFDEADVLFSKRTEVKDSNDKYNNMEAAFLLQKMECYEGITILATNYYNSFDEAFKRRIKFVIDFPFPNAQYRKELWKSVMPKEMPAEELDLEYLAKHFELSGSNIKNIILHSAFLAATQKEAVGMQHIIPAIKNEYVKNGKLLSKEDVLEYYMFLES